MTDPADLKQQAVTGTALQELRTHGGWSDLLEIFQALYNEAWDELKSHENPVARAKIQALEDIVLRIDDKVNLGQSARRDLQALTATSSAAP